MSHASSPFLGIGEVAERAGVAASTLRFYERAGLLPPPARTGGRRRYERGVLQRLAVIDVAKRAGFTLDEIRQLQEGLEGGMPSTERWGDMAARKLPQIDAVIQDAQRMRRPMGSPASASRADHGATRRPTPTDAVPG